jgi:hypothetical protein
MKLPVVTAATTAAAVFSTPTLTAVAAASVQLLQQYQAAVERPIRSHAFLSHLIQQLGPQDVERSARSTTDLQGVMHPVRVLLAERTRTVIRAALAYQTLPAHPTAGLEASHTLLQQMATELLIFHKHNTRVFGEFYGELIDAERTRAAVQASAELGVKPSTGFVTC